MDQALFFALYGSSGLAVWIGLSAIGSGWTMFGLFPFLALRKTRRAALMLMLALVLVAIVVFAMKLAVHRARPCACLPGVHSIFYAPPTDGSFPSGHAAGSFCFATFCSVFLSDSWTKRRAVGVAALLLTAAGIAISRVVLGVHWPLDIAAGAVIGTAIGVPFALRARARSIQTAPAE